MMRGIELPVPGSPKLYPGPLQSGSPPQGNRGVLADSLVFPAGSGAVSAPMGCQSPGGWPTES
jgi:hypothetical protein